MNEKEAVVVPIIAVSFNPIHMRLRSMNSVTRFGEVSPLWQFLVRANS